jgi:hypothetical protein
MPTSSKPNLSEKRFAAIVKALKNKPGVTPPDTNPAKKKFGSNALKVKKKIFAFLYSDDHLVVKLSKERVAELAAKGVGKPFSMGPGRIMKEWLEVELKSKGNWGALAKEAMKFVGSIS